MSRLHRHLIERAVEGEEVDVRLADDAEQRPFGPRGDQLAQQRRVDVPRPGYAIHLIKSRLGAQIGVEPRGGSGHQIGGNVLTR